MPTSKRKQREMSNRRQSVRRQYDPLVRACGAPRMAVDTLASIHDVSPSTIYKDLRAMRKEGGRK